VKLGHRAPIRSLADVASQAHSSRLTVENIIGDFAAPHGSCSLRAWTRVLRPAAGYD
jgi:hypothetical protein